MAHEPNRIARSASKLNIRSVTSSKELESPDSNKRVFASRTGIQTVHEPDSDARELPARNKRTDV